MNTSTCSTENCASTAAVQDTPGHITKAQPQWQSRKTDDGSAVVEIALPGVAREDLDLTTGNGFLKLEARRKPAEGDGRVIQGAKAPGAYVLGLRLATNLDGANANAKFEDGVLTVTLPLVEAARPRKIEVA